MSQLATPLTKRSIPNDSSREYETPAKKPKIDFNKVSCSTPKCPTKNSTSLFQIKPIEEKTNTTRCLEAVLGQSKDSARYDVVRKLCKRNPETFQDELKTLNAKFEVKLKIMYKKIKEDLRSFELNKIKKK